MKSPKPTTGYLWSAPIQYGVCWKTPGYGSQRKAELKKRRFNPVSRTADLPGQALNVDLGFVPVSHLVNVKLPAVSGSSGHLVVERMKETGQEWDYAGKIFADPELDYAEAVQAFVKASRPLFGPRMEAAPVEKPSRQAELQQVRQAAAQLCTERRNTRTRRKLEDAAELEPAPLWKAVYRRAGEPQTACPLGFCQSTRRAAAGVAPTPSSTVQTTPTGRRTVALEQKKFTSTNNLAAQRHGLDCRFDDHR